MVALNIDGESLVNKALAKEQITQAYELTQESLSDINLFSHSLKIQFVNAHGE